MSICTILSYSRQTETGESHFCTVYNCIEMRSHTANNDDHRNGNYRQLTQRAKPKHNYFLAVWPWPLTFQIHRDVSYLYQIWLFYSFNPIWLVMQKDIQTLLAYWYIYIYIYIYPVVKVVLWSRGLTWRSQVGANPIPIPTPLIWRYLSIK